MDNSLEKDISTKGLLFMNMSLSNQSENLESECSTSEQRPTIPSAAPETGSEYLPLDPLAVKLWRIEGLVSNLVLFLMAVIGGTVLWRFTGFPGWLAVLAWTAIALNGMISTIWLPPRKYSSWSYRLRDQVLEMRSGILWQKSVMIPLSRLQHVDLKRGPLERRLGLASIEIHTAGTRDASHEIPYLTESKGLQLREKLMKAADLFDQ